MADSNSTRDTLEFYEAGLVPVTSYDVGMSLAAIRDQRLYRNTHDTFKAYCVERWKMTPERAARLISDAEAIQARRQRRTS